MLNLAGWVFACLLILAYSFWFAYTHLTQKVEGHNDSVNLKAYGLLLKVIRGSSIPEKESKFQSWVEENQIIYICLILKTQF